MNERARVTPDIVQRLARAFNTSSGLWIGLQSGRDSGMLNIPPELGKK